MEEQFQDWVAENQGRIHSVCRFYTWEEEERKDLYQEILYQVWTSMPRFKGDSSPGTWIYRIAVNTALMFRRTAGRRKDTERLEQVQEPFSSPVESSIEQAEEQRLLWQAIRSLSEADQTLVLLYFEELSYQEISEVTGLSVSNVGARLSRIRKKLIQQVTPSI